MNVKFIIAEEVRPEANNKMSIMGLFPGDVIIVVKGNRPEGIPADTPAGIERLAILVMVNETVGLHKFKGRIIQPSGQAYNEFASLGEATIKKGFAHTVLIEVKPFVVKEIGMFSFEFFVDDLKYVFPFEVREQVESPI